MPNGFEMIADSFSLGILGGIVCVLSFLFIEPVVISLTNAKAGATYISPFIGRIDDMGEDGIRLIYDLKTVLENYGLESEIIAASIRTNKHLEEAALAGAHIATIPGTLFEKLWTHPLTTQGIESFKKDWDAFLEKTNK